MTEMFSKEKLYALTKKMLHFRHGEKSEVMEVAREAGYS
jgi:hypothetical protein